MVDQLVGVEKVNGVRRIKFFCPVCEQKMRVGEQMVGQLIQCRGCKSEIEVPRSERRGLLRRLFRH